MLTELIRGHVASFFVTWQSYLSLDGAPWSWNTSPCYKALHISLQSLPKPWVIPTVINFNQDFQQAQEIS